MSINAIQACLCLRLALVGPIASPNSPNRGFNPRLASHPPFHLPTPYNVLSVILHWFWKKLLKIQQCKLASRNSYKTLAKRLPVIQYMWPDLPKPDIMTHFGNPDFCISEFYIPKALFCSNINAVLQILFELQD